MEITKIIAFALTAMILILFIRQYRSEYAVMLEIVAGVCIFMMIARDVSMLFLMVANLTEKLGFEPFYLGILLKVVGISYIAELGMALCRDANQTALAAKIELAAKVLMMVISFPIFYGLLDKVATILR